MSWPNAKWSAGFALKHATLWRHFGRWRTASTRPSSRRAGSLRPSVRWLPVRHPQAELVASRVDRYPEEVETAIYLCCAEALRNSARQAPGSTVRLRIAELDGVLSFSAACDGPDLKDSAIVGDWLGRT